MFSEIHRRLTNAILDQIERERDGEDVDTSLLKTIIESYGISDDEGGGAR